MCSSRWGTCWDCSLLCILEDDWSWNGFVAVAVAETDTTMLSHLDSTRIPYNRSPRLSPLFRLAPTRTHTHELLNAQDNRDKRSVSRSQSVYIIPWTDLLFFTTSRLSPALRPFCAPFLYVSPSSTQVHPNSFIVSAISRHHSEQPNAATQAIFTDQWTRLLLAYARHRGLFVLRIEDAVMQRYPAESGTRCCGIRGSIVIVGHPFFCLFPPLARSLTHPGDLSFDLFLLSVAVKSNIVCDAPQGD